MGTQWHTTFWAPESLQMVTAAMKLKDACSYGKVMTNLDNMCESRDITLPTEVHLVKAVVFPVVIYGCENWNIKKAEHWRIDAFEMWCWRRLLRVLGLQGEPTSPSQRQSVLNIWWKDWCRSWNSSTLATWCEELPHLKRPWCWERLKMGKEGINREWDVWMASPTQWIWVWVKSGSWWWRGMSGMLKSTGSQRVGHDWETELNWASFLGIWMLSSPRTVLGNTVFYPLNDLTTFVKNRLTIWVKVLLVSEFFSIDL